MTTKAVLCRVRGAGCIGVALLLAACGSNNGSVDASAGSTPQQAEDAAASASVAGLVGFAQGQIARTDADTSEARPVAGINPPVSDETEPTVI